MFTSRKQLIKKSGNKGVDRFEYLQELVNEFHQSTSLESQEQVLANLANFAYDPLNYHYLRELKVIDIFISGLSSRNQFFNLYCIKGLCNLSNDPLNQEVIVKSDGINPIKQFLKSDHEDLCITAITTLMFLDSSDTDITEDIKLLTGSANCILANLAHIYLQDHLLQK